MGLLGTSAQLQLPTARPASRNPSIPAKRLEIFRAHLARLAHLSQFRGLRQHSDCHSGGLSSVQTRENDVETFHSALSKLCGISIRLLFSP